MKNKCELILDTELLSTVEAVKLSQETTANGDGMCKILALRRQRNPRVLGQPGLDSKSQDRKSYTTTKTKQTHKNKKESERKKGSPGHQRS